MATPLGLFRAGLIVCAVFAGSTMAYAADVLQPYNFTGTLTQSIFGDTSVTGSFTIDFTTQTVQTFDITAPSDVFNSAVFPSSTLHTLTGISPTGSFIQTIFDSAAGSPLELVFETSPPSRVLDFVTGVVSVSPIGSVHSEYICITQTCLLSAIGPAFFAGGSATLANVPEPASLALLGTALAGLVVLRRRNRNA